MSDVYDWTQDPGAVADFAATEPVDPYREAGRLRSMFEAVPAQRAQQ